MAFGFPPKYKEKLPLKDLTAGQFLALAVEAANKLNWKTNAISENTFRAYTNYSLVSWGEKIEVIIQDDAAWFQSSCTGSQLLDYGKNEKNIKSLIAAIGDLYYSCSPEQLTAKYEELKSATPAGTLLKGPKFKNALGIFIPTDGYFITPILINLNIAIFILMVICGVNFMLPSTESLIKWGANFRPYTLEGQWWRLITNCFLHIGIFHLLMNMYALFYIGAMLEQHLGRARFLSAYLLTGITASMTSVYWHELTVSAGASGAIFGMYGVFLAMLTTNLIESTERNAMLKSILIFVGYNLVYGMRGGIDNAAHIGGLVGGIFIGYVFVPGLRKPDLVNLKWTTIVLSAMVIFATCIIVNLAKPVSNDVGIYSTKIQQFVPLEAKAINAIANSGTISNEKWAYEIKNNGIPNWDAIITLVTDLDTLKLPEALHHRNKMLIEYCNFRIKAYEFTYQDAVENTSRYHDSIVFYNHQITSLMNFLKESEK